MRNLNREIQKTEDKIKIIRTIVNSHDRKKRVIFELTVASHILKTIERHAGDIMLQADAQQRTSIQFLTYAMLGLSFFFLVIKSTNSTLIINEPLNESP